MTSSFLFGLLFILCFAIAAIVTFTALRQWLVPAVADEPTEEEEEEEKKFY